MIKNLVMFVIGLTAISCSRNNAVVDLNDNAVSANVYSPEEELYEEDLINDEDLSQVPRESEETGANDPEAESIDITVEESNEPVDEEKLADQSSEEMMEGELVDEPAEIAATPIMITGAYLVSCEALEMTKSLCVVNTDFTDITIEELELQLIDQNDNQIPQADFAYSIIEVNTVLHLEIITAVQIKSVTVIVNEIIDNCDFINVSGTWVFVPGDPDYNTSSFCVMKYEAKEVNGTPFSNATGLPWVSLTQGEAISACESVGNGVHLVNKDEWMTIATNATAQDSNWSGALVGAGELTRGHSDDSPTQACEADDNDVNAYVEGNCNNLASGAFNQRRTITLSNSNVIWDLAGNVREWIDYFNNNDKPSPNSNDWYEYNNLSDAPNPILANFVPNNQIKSFWNNNWDSSDSIGQYNPGLVGEGGTVNRGGDWNDGARAGLFNADQR